MPLVAGGQGVGVGQGYKGGRGQDCEGGGEQAFFMLLRRMLIQIVVTKTGMYMDIYIC